ncbi:MAG: polyphosphate polymerase domain-containing protein [Muribaculaceae bacterium]|nr:polyphosphate polymerase domain-containing protein [Muribaculaceae bacterium]
MEEITGRFDSLTLEEMGKVELMNRVDSKFVTTVDKIRELLEACSRDYYVQEIGGRRNMPYHTVYYDTEDTDMYYQHQRGKKTRQKIRTRLYEGSMTIPFLEIKRKNNKGRTKKKRVSMEEGEILDQYTEFIEKNSYYTPEHLTPQIENHFYRITLVDKAMTERITIDTGLHFHNFTTGMSLDLDNTGIIEWKRDGISGKSGFGRLLRELHIHESGFSKYCMGMALTNPELRQNRIKARLRKILKRPHIS